MFRAPLSLFTAEDTGSITTKSVFDGLQSQQQWLISHRFSQDLGQLDHNLPMGMLVTINSKQFATTRLPDLKMLSVYRLPRLHRASRSHRVRDMVYSHQFSHTNRCHLLPSKGFPEDFSPIANTRPGGKGPYLVSIPNDNSALRAKLIQLAHNLSRRWQASRPSGPSHGKDLRPS